MPAKTERATLESELFKLREQHAASLAKALSSVFSPEEEAAHEERVKRMASLVQQLEALDAGMAPALVTKSSLRSPNYGNSNWKLPQTPCSEACDTNKRLSGRSALSVLHV